jgi:hypothetical protein
MVLQCLHGETRLEKAMIGKISFFQRRVALSIWSVSMQDVAAYTASQLTPQYVIYTTRMARSALTAPGHC